MKTKLITTAFFKPQRALMAMFIPGIFLLGLGLAAYAAPQLLAYFIAFFSVFFGTCFILLAYKVSRFMKRLADMQRQIQASVSLHGFTNDDEIPPHGFADETFSSRNFSTRAFSRGNVASEALFGGQTEVRGKKDQLVSLKKRSSTKDREFTEIIDENSPEKKIIFH